jgi:hypothetical protein
MTSRPLGRLLQLAGLAVMPMAIAAELAGRVGLGMSMAIAAVGAAIFFTGTRMLPAE